VRKIQPRGAIPALPQGEALHPGQALPTNGNTPIFFAAAFSTRSQIASPLRDTPESLALHSFNTMATSAVLAQLSTFGIDMPVFGVLFDGNMVRFHVDWSVPTHGYECRVRNCLIYRTRMLSVFLLALQNHITLTLPPTDHLPPSHSPFRDFDLTRPDDALRVAFMLDAIHSYAENRLAPAVAQWRWNSDTVPRDGNKLPLAQDEISSEEKVQAWMQSGAVDATGDSDS
jgi:hypothetical protein